MRTTPENSRRPGCNKQSVLFARTQANRAVDQQGPETDPHAHGQLIFDKTCNQKRYKFKIGHTSNLVAKTIKLLGENRINSF